MPTDNLLTAAANIVPAAHLSVPLERHWRQRLPEQILMCLPLTLFFPVGVMYAGIFFFYLALILSGQASRKLDNIRQSPLLMPVLLLTAVSVVIALTQQRPPEMGKEFWPALMHYQTYLLLLPFLALDAGEWQRKAVSVFFAGAVMASTLFVANFFHVLPDNTLFHSYVLYQGNKSILLGVLLAIAAGWMLHELRLRQNHYLLRILALLYVVATLVLLSKTRTASLMFFLMGGLILLRNLRWNLRSLLLPLVLLITIAACLKYVADLPRPASCVVSQVQLPPWEIAKLRAVCTIQQANDFVHGKKSSDDDGMRAEIYRITAGMIAEKPWSGHGIASWMPNYRERSQGLSSNGMTTPHNDYLLYATELGMAGVAALLWIWFSQFRIARKMALSKDNSTKDKAMLLSMLTLAMMTGAMFNAILRDAVFGLAFMILLAIPLAGLRQNMLRDKANQA